MAGEWHETLLRDLLVTTKDGDWGKEKPEDGYVPYHIIRGTDFPDVRVGDLSSVPLRYLPETTIMRRTLEPDDILIETAGGTRDRPTGRTLLITEKLLSRFSGPVTCASFARFLRVDRVQADPRFVFWYLQYLYEKGEMAQHQVQHTGVARFQYTRFAETQSVPLPSPAEQKAIASVLGALDDKIELNRRMNETLEALAQGLFKAWFVDPTQDGLPKGWREGTLGEVAENLRRGVQPDEIESSTPYIALEHMPRRCIALSEWGHAEEIESNKFEFKRGEILFGKLRPYFHKVGVAPLDGVCSTDILVVRAKEPEWFGFVLGHVSSVELVNHTNAASTGTKMPRTNWNDIFRFEVVLPPKELAAAFTEQIRPLVERIVANIHESRTLSALRDALLPKLLSGELRVPAAAKLVEVHA